MSFVPTSSPWGKIQHCSELVPGIFEVDTADHGGIMANTVVASQLLSPAALNEGSFKFGWYCFDEDSAQVALLELLDNGLISAPSFWKGTIQEYSDCIGKIVQQYHPEYWAARPERIAPVGAEIEQPSTGAKVAAENVISGLQNVVDASQALDKYSPEFLEVFCNKDTGAIWAIRQMDMGHEAVTEYSDPAIVKIGNLIEPFSTNELADAIAGAIRGKENNMEKNTPLMKRLIDAGYADKINHHDSDLYVEVTAGTDKIIKDWMRDNGYRTDKAGMEHWAPTFRDNITGKLTFDVPFQYAPYYEEKAAEKPSVLGKLNRAKQEVARQDKTPTAPQKSKDDPAL